ncbi:phosphatidylinositol 4-kinase [Babesia ovata]|uniref:Phosphatidylinositol 4-kinase n=1 Tax=Babesia ovata TaxID=189622 RepID=A0A2H6K808_9APIC|nr:phosphatidylinositol 4-kinase [Babesia ovata]GBE59133.1 phosphatidylinositol 4-kinase [Babesia ovata]
MKFGECLVLVALAFIFETWMHNMSSAHGKTLKPGVYKTLQTKGSAGKLIADFTTKLKPDRPTFHVAEVDLYRGESITITCPNAEGGANFYPSKLTTYYTSPPRGGAHLESSPYTKADIDNELLSFADERLGFLDDINDSLILMPYCDTSRRLSFLWTGEPLRKLSTMYFVCLNECHRREIYTPSALIAVRAIPDRPIIVENLIQISQIEALPQNHDLVYTKEYSPVDKLVALCKAEGDEKGIGVWTPVDHGAMQHNILHSDGISNSRLNPKWEEAVSLLNVTVNLKHIDVGNLTVKSRDLSSLFRVFHGSFYLSCTSSKQQSERLFHLVSNTVSVIDVIKPSPRATSDSEVTHQLNAVQHHEYNLTHARAVSLFCPLETHTLWPPSLLTAAAEKFVIDMRLMFPSTHLSKRGDYLMVIDFSNSSALEDMKLNISCKSRSPAYTSYIFTLSNTKMCLFDDNMEHWRPCKVILRPSEELIIRCPRRSEKEYYPLQPEDPREGYIKVDDDYVTDRHGAITRTLVTNPRGDTHKIVFSGIHDRSPIRDEIHFECSSHQRDYSITENSAIVIIKLVGNFEEFDSSGKIIIPDDAILKPADGPKLFHISLDPGQKRRIDCSDFFIDRPATRLYPNNEWEVFDDIPRFYPGVLADKIRGRPVYATRAMYGLTMVKQPKALTSSVELYLDPDYKLSSRSDNAMYFLCARNNSWDDLHSDVAVVQVYIQSNTSNYYGVSAEDALFRLDYAYARSTYRSATFNIAEHNIVALHCPKGPEDKTLPACHDINAPSVGAQNAATEAAADSSRCANISRNMSRNESQVRRVSAAARLHKRLHGGS